jgi:uncharacterized protein
MSLTVEEPGKHPAAERVAWDDLLGHVTVHLRPVASPAPLGFFGLAAATFVLSGLQLDWIDKSDGTNIAVVLLVFAFGAQVVAGIVGFVTRDVVVSTAMVVLALTWLATGLVMRDMPPGATSDALGLFLVFAGITVALCGCTALLGKVVPAAVLLVAGLRIATTGVYHLTDDSGWKTTAGILGLGLFAIAMYTALAAMLEGAAGKPVLPFGRRGRGQIAVDGSLLEQVQDVPNEPGVRMQL